MKKITAIFKYEAGDVVTLLPTDRHASNKGYFAIEKVIIHVTKSESKKGGYTNEAHYSINGLHVPESEIDKKIGHDNSVSSINKKS